MTLKKSVLMSGICCLCHILNLSAQSSDTLVKSKNNSFLLYPVVFFLPETNLGIGVAGVYNFRFKGEASESNPSQISFTANYTLKNQWLFIVPFELYKKNQKWKYKGELAYNIFFYNYYGIGTHSLSKNRETYDAEFPRFRLDVLRSYRKFFFGLRYRFDHFQIDKIKENGLLQDDNPTGISGGTTSGLGILLQYDSRDFIQFPTKGMYAESQLYTNSAATGSNFRFTRFSASVSTFHKISKDCILANYGYIISNSKGLPFFEMAYIGNPVSGRGFQDRRFIDRSLFTLQSELRFPVYRRFSGVTFANLSWISPDFQSYVLRQNHPSFGAGLRFKISKKYRARLRIDYAFARDVFDETGQKKWSSALYATINDAF
ncbi:MAG: BamA/TamA family outer membrane protein [Saprospiraceae bacterium]|nr:BamA/TamA family outer membrane protein [Saprospiraceae bacterium]